MTRLFEDLLNEDKDELDRKIQAMKRGQRAYKSGEIKWTPKPMPKGEYKAPSPSAMTNSRWIIPGEVIRACRPGYPSTSGIGEETVNKWLENIRKSVGVIPDSIITFLTDKELEEFYTFDLLSYYRKLGIQVRHMPKFDPVYSVSKDPVFTLADYTQISDWIEELDKPVLIHCSAGVDRTGEISRYLEYKEDKKQFEREQSDDYDQIASDIANSLSPEDKGIVKDQMQKFKDKFGDKWKKTEY